MTVIEAFRPHLRQPSAATSSRKGRRARIGRRLLLLTVIATAAHAAPARLTEADARAFVARQEQAWNAKDAAAFAATFTPDARFVDQARGSDNSIVPYGSSTLYEAIAQAKGFFGRAQFHETATVTRVAVAADGKSARVLGHEVLEVQGPRRPNYRCADTDQTLVQSAGRILSRGQTDTAVRCPPELLHGARGQAGPGRR